MCVHPSKYKYDVWHLVWCVCVCVCVCVWNEKTQGLIESHTHMGTTFVECSGTGGKKEVWLKCSVLLFVGCRRFSTQQVSAFMWPENLLPVESRVERVSDSDTKRWGGIAPPLHTHTHTHTAPHVVAGVQSRVSERDGFIVFSCPRSNILLCPLTLLSISVHHIQLASFTQSISNYLKVTGNFVCHVYLSEVTIRSTIDMQISELKVAVFYLDISWQSVQCHSMWLNITNKWWRCCVCPTHGHSFSMISWEKQIVQYQCLFPKLLISYHVLSRGPVVIPPHFTWEYKCGLFH